jgi:hypothetical protein
MVIRGLRPFSYIMRFVLKTCVQVDSHDPRVKFWAISTTGSA